MNQQALSILPFKINEISPLLSANESNIPPIKYEITVNTTDLTQLNIDISHLDHDSVDVSVYDQHIHITAQFTLSISFEQDQPLTLDRSISEHIPLPPNTDSSNITVEKTDSSLIFNIFHS